MSIGQAPDIATWLQLECGVLEPAMGPMQELGKGLIGAWHAKSLHKCQEETWQGLRDGAGQAET